MMTKEGSTQIVNLMTPGAGVLMLGCGHISHYSEYVVSSTLSIYITLIAITCVNVLWCWFLYHHWFTFILWWGCWYTHIKFVVLSTWYILIPCLLDSGRFWFYRKDKPEFCTMGAHMFLKHFLLGVADITQYLQCMGKCNFPCL